MPLVPLLLNFLLMLAIPVLLGWFISRGRRVSWRLFGIGAVTFLVSQLAHIPFNYLVMNQWTAGWTLLSETATLVAIALFLGASAGLFEEGARYCAYRFWAKDARTWGKGLMLGTGQGGAESMILGVLGLLNVVILIGYRAGYFQGLVPVQQAQQVSAALDQLVALPWYEMMFGALERVSALGIQLALSLIVMQVFTRGELRWLFVAFGWHALVDAAAVLAFGTGGIYASQAVAGMAAIASLSIIFWLRAPEPEIVAPEPLGRLRRARPTRIEPTKQKIEDSRYL